MCGKGIPAARPGSGAGPLRPGPLRPGPCRPPPRGGMARDGGARLMRGFGGTTLRGGQTVFHGIRMWGQMFQAAMLFAAFMTVAVPAWNLWNRSTGAEWYAAGMFTLAEFKLTVGYEPDSGQENPLLRRHERGDEAQRDRGLPPGLAGARERIKAEMFRSAWLGAQVGAGMIVLFLVVFWFRGAQLGRQRRLRGAELVTAGELRRRVRPAHLRALDRLPGGGRLRPYRIAGIPLPRAHRDPAHHRLGHHRVRQDRADLGPGRPDPRARRALRHLRQDGELHGGLLRSGPRRADEPARCPRAALVALPGSPPPPRLRHDGGRADPAAEGHRRPVLGDGGAAAVLERRRRVLEEGGDREPGPGRPPAQGPT